ncbi:MAG: amidoligase family protein [Roseovarius sp.]|uniref:amidoligase family protein n=1 Tax=Roseovarius sp. TaxID=1486281 RepID=UPI001B535D59|nr:amidoligase family protein [Roseovarius sp.]MBQ0749724.1 amidoligase family protein [Roseovarius sp.]MBQ0809799.1 amidoligase family protein [Roseovarius sp.]
MTAFSPLPQPLNAKGDPRLVGVEIELGGLPVAQVARLCAETLDGTASQVDSHIWRVENSQIGQIDIYLDIFLRNAQQSKLRDLALDLGRDVVPVEIVTAPLDRDGLGRLDDLRNVLRDAGALGSGAGWFFGFGLHLNIEMASDADADTIRPLLAYALIEDWLRAANPIDESRRLLPFTDPYPIDFTRALIKAGPDASRDHVTGLYLELTPSRNRGLDMLPLFAHFDAARIRAAITDKTSARPTFHFRLPDCRIDEADWSIADEWQRWLTVERVAADTALLTRLSQAWLDDHGLLTLSRQSWATRAGRILQSAGLDRA